MKITTTIGALLALLFQAHLCSSADHRDSPDQVPEEEQQIPAATVKPVLQRELNGVRFTVFSTDKSGRPSRDRAWLMVSNSSPRPMRVTGIITHSFEATLTGAPKAQSDSTFTIPEKFAHVVGAGKQVILWFCDGSKANGTAINLGGGKTVRLTGVRNVRVTKLVDLEVK